MKLQLQTKYQVTSMFILLFTLALSVLSVSAQAESGGRLRPAVNDSSLVVGQEVTVDVLVEDAPLIYGVDVWVTFDPNLLEVVDADESQDGVQFESGDFLDPEQSFVLQNHASNETGTIDYALALFNPAPPVQGDGLLARITFRAKAEGQTTISIAEGLFGTQTGETVAPLLESAEVRIATTAGEALFTELFSAGDESRFPIIGLSGGVLVLAGLVGVWLVLAARRRRRGQQ